MIRVTSKGFDTSERPTDVAHHYVLAGQPVVFDSEVQALSAYHTGTATKRFSELLANFTEPEFFNVTNSTLAYHGEAPFENQSRRVRFWRQKRCAQIDIDGQPVCQIDFDEGHIHLLDRASFSDRMCLEIVTGPALMLLLAELRTYCLHAGAVASTAGNIAIVAESGVGKSTLSASFNSSWQQISDDVLPVFLSPDEQNKPLMLADFPQLKLKNAVVSSPPETTLKLDYLLRVVPQPSNTIRFQKVEKPAAMLQIIRHTVATKLFDKTLMKQHTYFAKELSSCVPLLEVRYPRDKQRLPELREMIVSEFKALG